MAQPIDLDHLRTRDWWSKVDRSGGPEACWPWLQSSGSHGYGQTWDGITVRLSHRCAWELTYGRIPDGLTIDHECRTPRCCNPSHLRLLPNLDNATDNATAKANARKTECPRGHPYSPENTYRQKKGSRVCRTCARTVHRR